ncbi:hypothetical protein ABES80_10215 [Bacillus gobiensis]|uniref:hypothetical protein n=1 Tax=Bacillus gobiensis TaxID=1441095 RepID=UPI003D23B4F3
MSTKTRNDHLPGEVVTWKMSEEERLAYIAKHPIIPEEKPKPFDMVEQTPWSKN